MYVYVTFTALFDTSAPWRRLCNLFQINEKEASNEVQHVVNDVQDIVNEQPRSLAILL